MIHHESTYEGPLEIAMVGDLSDHEAEVAEKLLQVPPEGECTLYIDSPGGSAYSAMALLSVISLRRLRVTGIVTGECSSAALWPFAACSRRVVTPFSVFLFHPMKWQSEEHVALSEAAEWARHFAKLETNMDQLLAKFFGISDDQLHKWIAPGRYVSGPELASAGLAELAELDPPSLFANPAATPAPKSRRRAKSSAAAS